jgi:hypothetical protein
MRKQRSMLDKEEDSAYIRRAEQETAAGKSNTETSPGPQADLYSARVGSVSPSAHPLSTVSRPFERALTDAPTLHPLAAPNRENRCLDT